jgi:predicted nucleic acid-binding protein
MKQMNDNCFIDTNILVYCYTEDEPVKCKKAMAVCDAPNAFISTQVLTEFSNTLKKKFGFLWKDIELSLNEISSNFNVHVNKPATVEQACRIAEKYKYSFYDSLIVTASLACNCTILYSEDMQHGQVIEDRLKIVNPFI